MINWSSCLKRSYTDGQTNRWIQTDKQTDRQTTEYQTGQLTWAEGSGELKTKRGFYKIKQRNHCDGT